MGTARLTGASIHIEIGMTVGSPLAKDTSTRMQDIHKVSICVVQVSRPIVAHVEEDSGI